MNLIEMNAMNYSISDIAQQLDAVAYLPFPNMPIEKLAYDTRLLNQGERSLFFALQAERDGHAYIPQAYALGVRNFVIHSLYPIPEDFQDCNFIKVPDSLQALQTLAKKRREAYSGQVIGITGSNGKTIVKEWLYQLLSPDRRIYQSPKSYNSQLGVALALWDIDPDSEIALIEAGISLPGEMQKLQKMILPDQGILTNIKEAHLVNFKDSKALLNEKIQLFKAVKQVLYSPQYLDGQQLQSAPLLLSWGYSTGVSLQITDTKPGTAGKTLIEGIYKGRQTHIEIPFKDQASIENAVICWAYLLHMGMEETIIQARMQELRPLQMRMQLKHGLHQSLLIDDAYSFDLASLRIALQFLYQQSSGENAILIISDLPLMQSDTKRAPLIYAQLAALLKESPLRHLIGIGPQIQVFQELFSWTDCSFYPNTASFLEDFDTQMLYQCTLLIKGARSFAFEQITQRLSLQTHDTRLEINLNALSHNLKQIRKQVPVKTKIMGMVKAFSYGSGSYELARQLQFDQIDYLGVAYIDEGISLREHGIHTPIMVMNPNPQHFQAMIAHKLEPEIYSYPLLESFFKYAQTQQAHAYPIHLKIETGMNRLGFSESELSKALSLLSQHETLKVKSVFSHFAAASDPMEQDFTQAQIQQFTKLSNQISAVLAYPFIKHMCNSDGIAQHPTAHFGMVRAGIALYGISAAQQLNLQQVLQLKTHIAQIKNLGPGETIGYNRHGVLKAGGRIATVNIGYADGYDRRLGNGVGYMSIGSYRAPTIGAICMDMCMLDVTGLPVQEGDEVLVWGADPDISDLAAAAGMIPYELLTNISQRVKRIYLHE